MSEQVMGWLVTVVILLAMIIKVSDLSADEVFKGVGYVLIFPIFCVVLFFMGLWWLATKGRRRAVAGAKIAILFVRIWREERTRASCGDRGNAGPDANPSHAPPDPLKEALCTLGLPAGCTLEDLGRAYRQAIRHAHPDAGGDAAQAAAINAARDTIMQERGWAGRSAA